MHTTKSPPAHTQNTRRPADQTDLHILPSFHAGSERIGSASEDPSSFVESLALIFDSASSAPCSHVEQIQRRSSKGDPLQLRIVLLSVPVFLHMALKGNHQGKTEATYKKTQGTGGWVGSSGESSAPFRSIARWRARRFFSPASHRWPGCGKT